MGETNINYKEIQRVQAIAGGKYDIHTYANLDHMLRMRRVVARRLERGMNGDDEELLRRTLGAYDDNIKAILML